jgi:hypothetical protein
MAKVMEEISPLPESEKYVKEDTIDVKETRDMTVETDRPSYTLYKKRFTGVIGLVVLNVVGGLNWPWFGSISTQGEFYL